MSKQSLREKFAQENEGTFVENFKTKYVITNEGGLFRLLDLKKAPREQTIASGRVPIKEFKALIKNL